MKKIALISDTHSYFGKDIEKYLLKCDEIWHAGDIGDAATLEKYRKMKPLRAVYGNIDGYDVRIDTPEFKFFTMEDLKVLMIHIGGYPGRYTPQARELIIKYRPDIFISGHSHILKIMPDKKYDLLHINPGACGNIGFHKVRTLVLFDLDCGNIQNVRVVELTR
jgi:putative phosphoesterase